MPVCVVGMGCPILADYTDKRGYPPYDPRLMLRLLIYGYTTGVRSSRAIERKCANDVAFRYLAADQAPDYRSIARFRRRLDALANHRRRRIMPIKRCQKVDVLMNLGSTSTVFCTIWRGAAAPRRRHRRSPRPRSGRTDRRPRGIRTRVHQGTVPAAAALL